ncbi:MULTISPECIES: DUF5665 domain-containing protein [Caloramator]|jgi:hypothetical protein|uniref:Uncharacterized protein n=1 Tax=Caloramator australicus RC3 TaxID=857293 RepID=I7J519_9CLOT|nr:MULTISPECIES: DUF5665 domain-containing protein [Caloramator]MDO6354374.1 DUF5665 domain-containing protein [Caloramator sp. CAR-1]WDU84091.1 DUF5665 domain-containing protein [Caloramator sp. Dgby_cultured_2]CCJ33396.1 hypothetical protein CAAU_1312 [Caloramator australicus RC3]
MKEKKDLELIKNLSLQLERAKIGDYVDLMQNPTRLILLNFISGIARGVGIGIGFTILSAFIIYVLQRLVMLNLPLISGIISEIIRLVKYRLPGA